MSGHSTMPARTPRKGLGGWTIAAITLAVTTAIGTPIALATSGNDSPQTAKPAATAPASAKPTANLYDQGYAAGTADGSNPAVTKPRDVDQDTHYGKGYVAGWNSVVPDATEEPTEEATDEPAEEPTEEVTEEPTEEAEPEMTAEQEQAVGKAQDYLDYSAFSKKGLIKQLKYEGFSTKDATFAVNHIDVNWKKQAAKKAEDYLEYSNFSKSGLIKQLEYEGFTHAQAVYGANKAL